MTTQSFRANPVMKVERILETLRQRKFRSCPFAITEMKLSSGHHPHSHHHGDLVVRISETCDDLQGNFLSRIQNVSWQNNNCDIFSLKKYNNEPLDIITAAPKRDNRKTNCYCWGIIIKRKSFRLLSISGHWRARRC